MFSTESKLGLLQASNCLSVHKSSKQPLPLPHFRSSDSSCHGMLLTGPCPQVPAYERFINELFERCLDLYLCPRARRKKPREKLTSESFIPQLPNPKDLQPFPTMLCIKYEGHTGKVCTVLFYYSFYFSKFSAHIWTAHCTELLFSHTHHK